MATHAEPAGQPHGEPETAVVAELDKLASEEEAATETEVVSPEPPESDTSPSIQMPQTPVDGESSPAMEIADADADDGVCDREWEVVCGGIRVIVFVDRAHGQDARGTGNGYWASC